MKFDKLLHLLLEGGAAGHMWHPFDIPTVKTGKDLLNIFYKTVDSLSKTPASVKIDGVNFSFRVIRKNGKYQFVRDGGTSKELDINGVGIDDLENRWKSSNGKEHGLTTIGKQILSELNANMDSLLPYMKKLDVVCDEGVMPCKIINAEYVDGKTNTIDYSGRFLALHGVLQSDWNDKKRISTAIEFNKNDLANLVDVMSKVLSIKVFGKLEVLLNNVEKAKSEINNELQKSFTINGVTKTLNTWLNSVDNPGADIRKKPYLDVLDGNETDDLASAVFYHATRVLGKAILKNIDDMQNQEGVVIEDVSISPKPFKLTGDFLVTNVTQSKFSKKSKDVVNEAIKSSGDEWCCFVGSFKPPHKGHFEAILQNLDKVKGDGKFVVIIGEPSKKESIRSSTINAVVAKRVFELYCKKYDLPMDKIMILTVTELMKDKSILDAIEKQNAMPNVKRKVSVSMLASPVLALKFFIESYIYSGDTVWLFRGSKDSDSMSMFDFIIKSRDDLNFEVTSLPTVYKSDERTPLSATELRSAIDEYSLNKTGIKNIQKFIPTKIEVDEFLKTLGAK